MRTSGLRGCLRGNRATALSSVGLVVLGLVQPGSACIAVPAETPSMIITTITPCDAWLCFQGYETLAAVAGDQCAAGFDVSQLSCVEAVTDFRIQDAATGDPMPGWGTWEELARVGDGFNRVAELLGEPGADFIGWKTDLDGDLAAGVDIEVCVRVSLGMDCTPEAIELELLAAGFLLGAAITNDDGELNDAVSVAPLSQVDAILQNPCPQDIDESGTVDFEDVLRALNLWGPCDNCIEDLDCSGAVDFGDIVLILPAWGDCPK